MQIVCCSCMMFQRSLKVLKKVKLAPIARGMDYCKDLDLLAVTCEYCEVLFTHLYLLLCNHHVITPRGHVKDNQSPLSVRVLLAA